MKKFCSLVVSCFLLCLSVQALAAPNAPSMAYETNGLNLNITWSQVPGATSYSLYYAPYPYTGDETIDSISMGSTTSFNIDLWENAAYYIAVKAYNDTEDSDYSNIEQFTIRAQGETNATPLPGSSFALLSVTDSSTGLPIGGVNIHFYTDAFLTPPSEGYGSPITYSYSTNASGKLLLQNETYPDLQRSYWLTISKAGYESLVAVRGYYPVSYPEIYHSFELIPRPTEIPETNKYKEAYDTLRTNAPALGPIAEPRATALSQLDALLVNEVPPLLPEGEMDKDVKEFYYLMQKNLLSELDQDYPSVKIWKLDNMAVLIKEGDTIIGVDLTNDVFRLVGKELLQRIDALFVTHEHRDHLDSWLLRDAMKLGVQVYMPSEITTSGFGDHEWTGHDLPSLWGAVGLAPDESIKLNDWSVLALPGYHGVPIRLYLITTPSGIKILHTGDVHVWGSSESPSYSASDFAPVDYLVWPAWSEWLDSYIADWDPTVYIPTHLQELGHLRIGYNPGPYSRLNELSNQERMYFLHYGESVGGNYQDGFTAVDDCNDLAIGINPAAEEVCGDGIDQDCDGVDAVCFDNDGDGFAEANDCNDYNQSINPDAEEVCGDGIDQDCSGEDQNCIVTSSYTDNGNGTVTDNSTGFIWQQSDDDQLRDWQSSTDYCDGLTLGGSSSWRLPIVEELETLIDHQFEHPPINPVFVGTNIKGIQPSVLISEYWSSTSNVGSEYAWHVEFDWGYAGQYNKTGRYYVRCVR